MPAAAFIVPAVASIVGGVIAHKSASSANKAQLQATDSALTYQRERDAKADKRYEEGHARYLADLEAWKARHGFGSTPAAGTGAKPWWMEPARNAAAGNTAASAAAAVPAEPAALAPAATPVMQQPGAMPGPDVSAAPGQGLTLRDLASAGSLPGAGVNALVGPQVSSMPQMGQGGPRTLRDLSRWDYLQGQA